MKVLFIGNSHTYYNDMPAMYQRLCREHGIDMPGQDGGIAGGGADDELVGLTVKNQTVGRDNFQGEGCHLPSPPLYLATTSSMEPAYRK